ncbi:MAG: hypothetical protein ACAH17_00630, partial [Candidatus Paceibacterota bacterium]
PHPAQAPPSPFLPPPTGPTPASSRNSPLLSPLLLSQSHTQTSTSNSPQHPPAMHPPLATGTNNPPHGHPRSPRHGNSVLPPTRHIPSLPLRYCPLELSLSGFAVRHSLPPQHQGHQKGETQSAKEDSRVVYPTGSRRIRPYRNPPGEEGTTARDREQILKRQHGNSKKSEGERRTNQQQ